MLIADLKTMLTCSWLSSNQYCSPRNFSFSNHFQYHTSSSSCCQLANHALGHLTIILICNLYDSLIQIIQKYFSWFQSIIKSKTSNVRVSTDSFNSREFSHFCYFN